MSIVTCKLIGKELYVNRWFMLLASAAALASAAIASLGRVAFNIGSLTWITTIIALGVMLGIYGIMNERKEQSLEFVLSLPLTVREYIFSKIAGLLLCFLVPWSVGTVSAVVLVLATEVPDGLLPYLLLLCQFMLTNYSLVLCGAIHARSEGAVTGIIIVTNMGVSLFMFLVGGLPSLSQHMFGPVSVWNQTFYTVLLIELAIFLVALILPLLVAARRRDFI
jgi:ABC-type transport system involved in multi-copper enzyme maturation permease subunit